MSNSEMAAFLEKETLRDAEESDYQLMQDLIQHRIGRDAGNDVARFDNNAFFSTAAEGESRSQVLQLLFVRVCFLVVMNTYILSMNFLISPRSRGPSAS